LVLAGFGLGSLTFAVWIAEYRWIFLAATVLFLSLTFYRTYKSGRKPKNRWGLVMLYGTTALSAGLIIFTLVYR
jgi:hypothetical protein